MSDYYTNTEIDTQLTGFATTTYLQNLMNNYASISLPSAKSYDKTYLENQFSLKVDADASQLSSLATVDCLNLKYRNNVEISTNYYAKAELDNMLLSYSTGSYVDDTFYNKAETDNLLANKVSNIGNVSLPR